MVIRREVTFWGLQVQLTSQLQLTKSPAQAKLVLPYHSQVFQEDTNQI